METVFDLSLIASRLLIVLLLRGEEAVNSQRKTETMHLLGTNNLDAYRNARLELEQRGFIHIKREPGKQAHVYLTHQPFLSSAVPGSYRKEGNILLVHSLNGTTGGSDDIGTYPSYVPQASETPQVGEETYVPSTLGKVGTQLNQVPRKSRYLGKVGTLLDRCREVDDMDDGGEVTSKNSPFALRRKEQIPLVQEAYKQYFPQDQHILTDKNAKTWLSQNDNSVVQVVQELEAIAQRKPDLQGPIAYINKVFKGERSEAPKTTPFVSSAVSVLERPKVGAGAYIPGGDLPPPSPEYLEKLQEAQERFERLKLEKGWAE